MVIDASGWYARILQHEIHHLGGTLYVDRMRPRTMSTARNFSRYWAGVTIAEVLATLERKAVARDRDRICCSGCWRRLATAPPPRPAPPPPAPAAPASARFDFP